MSETKKEKKIRQKLSWIILPVTIFSTAQELEVNIKQQEDDGYELFSVNDKWMFFKKAK